jgi:hypothetical protein
MTTSGKSVFYFGLYVLLSGILFLVIPEKIISLNGFPPLQQGWSTAIGCLALVIGAYDTYAGKNNVLPMIRFSVYVRIGFCIATVLVVVSGQMPATFIGFGVIDAIGALITASLLKKEKN